MSDWYQTFDGIFWMSLATLISGSVAFGIRYCLKMKCEQIKCCCGCISIKRNIELEVKEEMEKIKKNIKMDEDEPSTIENKINDIENNKHETKNADSNV